jgi:hypothetical protein
MEDPIPLDMLLVKDNPADIYLGQRAVADCSPAIRPWVRANGREAVRFLRKEYLLAAMPSPALSIVDLSLPGRDSHDVIREIRGCRSIRRGRWSCSVPASGWARKRTAWPWGPAPTCKNPPTLLRPSAASRLLCSMGWEQSARPRRIEGPENT